MLVQATSTISAPPQTHATNFPKIVDI
jgi:hypothetical protein